MDDYVTPKTENAMFDLNELLKIKFELEGIFKMLTELEVIPKGLTQAEQIALFFPDDEAPIKRTNVIEKYQPSRRDKHWLLTTVASDRSATPLFPGESLSFCKLCMELGSGRYSTKRCYLTDFIKQWNTKPKNPQLIRVFWNMLCVSGDHERILAAMERKARKVLNSAAIEPNDTKADLIRRILRYWLKSENEETKIISTPQHSQEMKLLEGPLERALSRAVATAAILNYEATYRNNKRTPALDIIWSVNSDPDDGPWRSLIGRTEYYRKTGKQQKAYEICKKAYDDAISEHANITQSDFQELVILYCSLCSTNDFPLSSTRHDLELLCREDPATINRRSEALFLRGSLKSKGIGYSKSDAAAFADYLTAANDDSPYIPALQLVGHAFMEGKYEQEVDIDKAYDYLYKGHIYGDGSCSYDLAQLCENTYEGFLKKKGISTLDIKNYYQTAANQGYVKAKNKVRDINFKSNVPPSYEEGGILQQCICFTNDKNNGDNPYINAFISGEHYFDEVINLSKHCCIEAILQETPSHLRSENLVFALMSQNYSQNVLEAVNLIRYLIDYSEEFKQREDWRRIDLYVLSTDESAPHIIDAALDNADEPVFFRVHTLDPDVISTNLLLFKHPTFIPCIRSTAHGRGRNENVPFLHAQPHDCERRIVIIGTNRIAFTLTKQILGCTYLSSVPTQINILGENAQEWRIRFLEECYGLSSADVNIDFKPSFFTCSYNRIPINRNSGLGKNETAIRNVLHNANYIAICTEDDELNLHLGIKLRSGLLAETPTPDTRPFIAIRYRQSAPGWLATQMAVHPSKQASYPWTSEYALCVFGSYDDFNYLQLKNSLLDVYATRLHLSYYDIPQTDKANETNATNKANEARAMRSFYMRSYNQSSSQAQALSILYELFALGIYYDDPSMYSTANDHAVLGRAMKDLINDASLETASAIEHERWNCYMLANGWRQAKESEYQLYIHMGNEKHHLELAKLHPYIATYDELEKIWRSLQDAFRTNFGSQAKELADPREADRRYIRILHRLLEAKHPVV